MVFFANFINGSRLTPFCVLSRAIGKHRATATWIQKSSNLSCLGKWGNKPAAACHPFHAPYVAADRLRGAAAEARAQRRPPAHAEAHRGQVRNATHLQVRFDYFMIYNLH